MRKIGAAIHAISQPTDALVYRDQVSYRRNPRTPVNHPTNPGCKFQDVSVRPKPSTKANESEEP